MKPRIINSAAKQNKTKPNWVVKSGEIWAAIRNLPALTFSNASYRAFLCLSVNHCENSHKTSPNSKFYFQNLLSSTVINWCSYCSGFVEELFKDNRDEYNDSTNSSNCPCCCVLKISLFFGLSSHTNSNYPLLTSNQNWQKIKSTFMNSDMLPPLIGKFSSEKGCYSLVFEPSFFIFFKKIWENQSRSNIVKNPLLQRL